MKPRQPLRLRAFACSAVSEVRAITGIRRVAYAAFKRSSTARPSMPGML
jgi:hypothetical protein